MPPEPIRTGPQAGLAQRVSAGLTGALADYSEAARADAQIVMLRLETALRAWSRDMRAGTLSETEARMRLRRALQGADLPTLRGAGIAPADQERFRALLDTAFGEALAEQAGPFGDPNCGHAKQ